MTMRNPQTSLQDDMARYMITNHPFPKPAPVTIWHVLLVYVFLAYYLYQTWSILGEVFNV